MGARLAARLAKLRVERGWSLEELARRTEVSRSTLSRLERGEISPTAALLGRLCAAYERTMSRLLAEVEAGSPQLVRAGEQTVWRDEESGYELREADCLRFRLWGRSRFRCLGTEPVRYALLVVLP